MVELDIPVYSAKELNKLLKDSEFSSRIGGYSTFSLNLVRQGFVNGSFSIPTYGSSDNQYVNVDLHTDCL